MDTKLKRSKIIRSFIYRIVAAGALLTTLAIGILGREAFINVQKEGTGTLTGNIYYLTEFREYIATLYTQGMLGYVGIGDDNGYPLTDFRAEQLETNARQEFTVNAQKSVSDLIYYVYSSDNAFDTGTISGNISYPVFSEYDGHLLLPEDVTLCCFWDGESGQLEFFSRKYNSVNPSVLSSYYSQQYSPNSQNTEGTRLILAFQNKDTYQSLLFKNMAFKASCYRYILIAFGISAAITLLSWFCCLFTIKAGRQARKEFLRLSSMVWLEIRILILAILLYLCNYAGLLDFYADFTQRMTARAYLPLYLLTGIALYLFWQDLKGHGMTILKQSFLYRLYVHFKNYIGAVSWYRKAMNMYHVTLAGALLLLAADLMIYLVFKRSYHYGGDPLNPVLSIVMPAILILLPLLALGLLFASVRMQRFIKDTEALTHKLAAMSAGTPGAPVSMDKKSLLRQAAADLNAVENGIEIAVEENNRSNQMRVDLITNVSHDLKTPLTSIINYADLLCEENLPAPANEYASALQAKAYRLKSMVQDVFDLSKATSGNLRVEKSRLDLAKLIRQTLADMDEKIQDSTLSFKLNITTEPLMIEADGEKLYRIFQNLINNALQYSLANSRVHVLLEQKGDQACAKIKNTSYQELNFTADEIVERFVRADASRTTEGSGLGLSIVQSFTEACGGSFSIEMDADLFTACVAFPLSPEPAENDSTQEGSETSLRQTPAQHTETPLRQTSAQHSETPLRQTPAHHTETPLRQTPAQHTEVRVPSEAPQHRS